jgi:omega-6 fatty acid desaturase (delta-12 desaturase)
MEATLNIDDASPASPSKEAAPRDGKALIDATKPMAAEDKVKSWTLFAITWVVAGGFLSLAAQAPWWPLRLVGSLLGGLTLVRLFIFFHDYMHAAIFRGSKVAKPIMWLYGVYVMTPPQAWRDSHNYHHAHTAKIVGSHVGSYAMVTPALWAQMKPIERRMYKIIRHPLTILAGYFTIFFYGMCLSPFLRDPKKNWDAGVTLVFHTALTGLLLWKLGFAYYFFVYFLPLATATASGAYLFYAQHNFPDIDIQPRHTWSFVRAALESSSYLETGPVMRWFTGNIGYHHVHHLNAMIPFYRLPETMDAIPELQHPGKTSLRPSDILACFKLKLWDPDQHKMVPFPAE